MARPNPQSKRVSFNFDTSGLHLIDRLSPGPLGFNDTFDPNLSPRLTSDVERDPFASPFHLLPENSLKLPTLEEIFAESEFELLKGKISDTNISEYVARRTVIFGSTSLYDEFAKESDKELADNPVLRKLIQMGGKSEKEQSRQTVFYRWVREAYLSSGAKDVPSLIKTGKSERLKKALTEVQAAHSGTFKVGGFNPRPQKNAKYQYILGTISDHALGLAIDIEDRSNPILSADEWKFLEDFTNKKGFAHCGSMENQSGSVVAGHSGRQRYFRRQVAGNHESSSGARSCQIQRTTKGNKTETSHRSDRYSARESTQTEGFQEWFLHPEMGVG